MENTQDTARESEIKRLLACIDDEYQCAITAFDKLKPSAKRDRFIQKPLDTIVALYAQIATIVGTVQASVLISQHIGEEEVHSLVIENTWAAILLVDYRLKYAKMMHLARKTPGKCSDEINELMRELTYITQTLHDTIGIEQTIWRIRAILSVKLGRGEEKVQ